MASRHPACLTLVCKMEMTILLVNQCSLVSLLSVCPMPSMFFSTYESTLLMHHSTCTCALIYAIFYLCAPSKPVYFVLSVISLLLSCYCVAIYRCISSICITCDSDYAPPPLVFYSIIYPRYCLILYSSFSTCLPCLMCALLLST